MNSTDNALKAAREISLRFHQRYSATFDGTRKLNFKQTDRVSYLASLITAQRQEAEDAAVELCEQLASVYDFSAGDAIRRAFPRAFEVGT